MCTKEALLLALCLAFASRVYALPSFQETRDSYKKSDAILLDRHGQVLHELRIDPLGRRLDWTSIKNISPALMKAVVHSEDRRFFEHAGVDWIALGSALLKNIFSSSPRGASTITMQLASLLEAELKPKNHRKTMGQKWEQIKTARQIEKRWTKDEILEAYLNLVTFRGELQGISSAARGLFDKEPSGLDDAESLVLAALLHSPNAPAEKVTKSACMLAGSLRTGTSCDEIKRLAEKRLAGTYVIRQSIVLAPHVAYKLLAKNTAISERLREYPSALPRESAHSPIFHQGSKTANVVSTLDRELQRFAAETLRRQLAEVKFRNVNDGAVLVVENSTGQVLAYVSGTGDESKARYVDAVQARRQAGSTLKPFLYAIAFEKGILTAASLMQDSPLEIPTVSGIYKPENYESAYKGMVSARTALASSLNVPAVRTLSLVGTDTFVQRLRQLGFEQLERADYYGPSLALGSTDVSLWELVNAYRTLANNGLWSEMHLTLQRKTGDRRRLFSEEVAFLVSDILSDREARSATFSLENPLATRHRSSVKTGTSKDMRDNWCIGYTEKYTVGVWVGNFSGEPMWNVSGITGAAPVWLGIMDYLHRGVPGTIPVPPAGVVAARVEFPYGIDPARNEWFIRGTEPLHKPEASAPVSPAGISARARIIHPVDETIIALDPDIPEEFQRMFFEAETGNGHYQWVLDDQPLGGADKHVSWKPLQGKHLLSLMDERMAVVDSVRFEVRSGIQQFLQPQLLESATPR